MFIFQTNNNGNKQWTKLDISYAITKAKNMTAIPLLQNYLAKYHLKQ